MALAQEDIRFIQDNIGKWLADQSLARPPVVYEIELRERMVRVEEALRHQYELMQRGFDAMDRRFEAVDKHFEAMQEQMDKRFEAMDRRFEAMQEQIDKRFIEQTRRLDRFMIWSFATVLTTGGLVVASIKLLP